MSKNTSKKMTKLAFYQKYQNSTDSIDGTNFVQKYKVKFDKICQSGKSFNVKYTVDVTLLNSHKQ